MGAARFDDVLLGLQRSGLLLLTDPRLPSVAGLVAGAPVRGSWWAHPRSQAIFAVALRLEDHPDVLMAKLVAGKVTFVHRDLWPALLAVAAERGPWQMRGLSPAARSLLRRVDREGEVFPGSPQRAAARALEARLLARSGEVHTATGAHARVLEAWPRWAARAGTASAKDVAAARRALEEAVAALDPGTAERARLPWQGLRTRGASRRSAGA